MAVTMITNPKEVSFLRSPLVFGVDNPTPTTNEVKLDLHLFTGDLNISASQSNQENYIGLKFPEEEKSYINISNTLIKYFNKVDQPFWVTFDIEDFNGTINYGHYALIVDGYSIDYTINYGYDVIDLDSRFMMELGTLNVCDTSTFTFPVYVGATSNNSEISTSLGDVNFIDFGTVSLGSYDSSEQIFYVTFGGINDPNFPTWNQEKIFEYSVDTLISSNPIKHKMYISCCQDSYKLKYKNSFGNYSEFPIQNMKINQKFKKEDFNNQSEVWDTDNNTHLDEIYLSNGETFLDLSTGWIWEDSDKMINDLLLSNEVYLITDDITYSVNIINSNKRRINRNFKRQIGYDIKLKLSHKIINRIY